MRNVGISGKTGKWILNFLANRNQQVIVNQDISKKSKVTSGVPQGSVLGPLLFLSMINDINDGLQSTVSLFADDTRIGKNILVSSAQECVEKLQEDLNKLYSWQERNNIKFNGSKFELIRYGRKQDLKDNTMYFSTQPELVIEEAEHLRDLGEILSSDILRKLLLL